MLLAHEAVSTIYNYQLKYLYIEFLITMHVPKTLKTIDIDGLVQERRKSMANALELHISYTNPSISFLACCLYPLIHTATHKHKSVLILRNVSPNITRFHTLIKRSSLRDSLHNWWVPISGTCWRWENIPNYSQLSQPCNNTIEVFG